MTSVTKKRSGRSTQSKETSAQTPAKDDPQQQLIVPETELNDWINNAAQFLTNHIHQYAETHLVSSLPRATSSTALPQYTVAPQHPQMTALELGRHSLSMDLSQMVGHKQFKTNSGVMSSSRTKSNVEKSLGIGEDVDITAAFIAKRNANWQQHRSKSQKKRNTAGKMWFDLPMGRVNKEVMMDYQMLQMRGSLLDTGHYMNVEKSKLPKFFQIGTVIEGNTDGRMRISKKNRQRSITDQFMHDSEIKDRVKKRSRAMNANVVHSAPSQWKSKKGKPNAYKKR